MNAPLRLYFWSGNGISDAYHDDGVLVVLAESPEHARKVVANARRAYAAANTRARPALDAIRVEMDDFARANGGFREETWRLPGAKVLIAKRDALTPRNPGLPDGDGSAMDREPDFIQDIDKPGIVLFNGGGYD